MDSSASNNQNEGNKIQKRPKPSMSDILAGESKHFVSELSPYLPPELVGGAVPYVPGTEDEAVWNAASQACSTEKVNYTYTIYEGKCWYLACPSSALASNPDSWCPLAAALPGNSEFWDTETVYIYEQEGTAAALRWEADTGRMQLYIGAARTILPRVQSMEANFITINHKMADIVPWKNRSLKTEKLSRATARVLLIAGLTINFICIAVLGVEYSMTNAVDRNLQAVKQNTIRVSENLMLGAYKALQSDAIRYMVRVQEISDILSSIDGTLTRFEVKKGGRVEWEALVPQAYSGGLPGLYAKVQPGLEKDGRVRIRGTK